jgi:hypothetical protein
MQTAKEILDFECEVAFEKGLESTFEWYRKNQRSEDRGQKTEVRGQRSEDRGQKTEVRGQRSEDRGQKTEVRRQKT